MLMFICMYVYVCISLFDRIMIVYANVHVYDVCIHVSMSLPDRFVGDHSFGGMIAYAGE